MKMTGFIFNIQKFSLHDGPGIRTLVFLKGCPLSCLWCSNPEGQSRSRSLFFDREKCETCDLSESACPLKAARTRREVLDSGRGESDDPCLTWQECIEKCPHDALVPSGRLMSVAEVLDIVKQDLTFYEESDGGMTLGGGDPISQAEFALNLLKACHEAKINTAMESSAYAPWKVLDRLTDHVDSMFVDMKVMDSQVHRAVTGVPNEPILRNIKALLRKDIALTIRIPVVPGINDNEENVHMAGRFLENLPGKQFQGVELLRYHKLGLGKVKRLGIEAPFQAPRCDLNPFLNTARSILETYGIRAFFEGSADGTYS